MRVPVPLEAFRVKGALPARTEAIVTGEGDATVMFPDVRVSVPPDRVYASLNVSELASSPLERRMVPGFNSEPGFGIGVGKRRSSVDKGAAREDQFVASSHDRSVWLP